MAQYIKKELARNTFSKIKKVKNRYWRYLLLTSTVISSAEIAKIASNAGVFGVAVGAAVVAIGVGVGVGIGVAADRAVISMNPELTPALP